MASETSPKRKKRRHNDSDEDWTDDSNISTSSNRSNDLNQEIPRNTSDWKPYVLDKLHLRWDDTARNPEDLLNMCKSIPPLSEELTEIADYITEKINIDFCLNQLKTMSLTDIREVGKKLDDIKISLHEQALAGNESNFKVNLHTHGQVFVEAVKKLIYYLSVQETSYESVFVPVMREFCKACSFLGCDGVIKRELIVEGCAIAAFPDLEFQAVKLPFSSQGYFTVSIAEADFNRGGQGARMPAITPASTMPQQPMGSTEGTLTTASILSSSQPGVQQGVPPGIDTPGNLPILPNPPIQGQNKDRKIIWSGMLEYQEKIKSSEPTQPKMPQQLQCQLSIGATDGEINTANWPKELIMQLIPQSLLSSQQLQPFFKSSRQVAFHFGNHNVESLRNLHRSMDSGFAGCVHFPPGSQCDVRVLLLLFSNKKKAFIGLIPNDQKAFVDGIRNVILSHKLKVETCDYSSHELYRDRPKTRSEQGELDCSKFLPWEIGGAAKHAGHLLLEAKQSAFKPYSFGLLFTGSKITMTCLKVSPYYFNHVAEKLKENDEGKLYYTDMFDIFMADDRKELVKAFLRLAKAQYVQQDLL